MELTTSDAVRKYDAHPNVILRLILTGRLKARKNANGRWLISKESLERWNARRVRRAQHAPVPSGVREEIAAPAA